MRYNGHTSVRKVRVRHQYERLGLDIRHIYQGETSGRDTRKIIEGETLL